MEAKRLLPNVRRGAALSRLGRWVNYSRNVITGNYVCPRAALKFERCHAFSSARCGSSERVRRPTNKSANQWRILNMRRAVTRLGPLLPTAQFPDSFTRKTMIDQTEGTTRDKSITIATQYLTSLYGTIVIWVPSYYDTPREKNLTNLANIIIIIFGANCVSVLF